MSQNDTCEEELEQKGIEDAQKVIQIKANLETSSATSQIDPVGFLLACVLMALAGLAVVLPLVGIIEVIL